MGTLAEGMTRLREDMDTARRDRQAFLTGLQEETAQTRYNNRAMSKAQGALARAERAEFIFRLQTDVAAKRNTDRAELLTEAATGRANRRAFTRHLAADTAALRIRFREEHLETARTERNKRSAFLSDLREDVGGMRHAFQSDLSEARRSFYRISKNTLITTPTQTLRLATAPTSAAPLNVFATPTAAPDAPPVTPTPTTATETFSKATEAALTWSRQMEAELARHQAERAARQLELEELEARMAANAEPPTFQSNYPTSYRAA